MTRRPTVNYRRWIEAAERRRRWGTVGRIALIVAAILFALWLELR
jgi:hypothetical protein